MAILTVGQGSGFEFQTIAAAVAAASSGDTIEIEAGKYVDDYPPVITQNLTIEGVGGQVQMIATAADPPPTEKGILVIGSVGATPNVTVENVTFRNTRISNNDGGNGAGIRYQGGDLTLIHDSFINNQDGMLADADPAGTITVDGCTFNHNGSGTGLTHNIYVNDVGTLTLEHSRFLDAVVGHEIKSRASNTIIKGNLIADGPTGTASYSIDLPNGGNAVIENNTIEKGPDAQNPFIITSGEEGNVYASSSLLVSHNTILNDYTAGLAIAVRNDTPETAQIIDNKVWDLTASQMANGPADVSDTIYLPSEPPWGPQQGATVSAATLAAASGTARPGFIARPDDPGRPGQAAAPAGGTGGEFAQAIGAAPEAPDLSHLIAGAGDHHHVRDLGPGVDHLNLAGAHMGGLTADSRPHVTLAAGHDAGTTLFG